MGDMAPDQEDIAIFWDFDSTKSQALGSELQPSEIVQNIRSAVSSYGTIKSFRAYGNFSAQALLRATNVRSDLFASGLTLMECPNDGRKELGVKIMLVDMVAHAWSHNAPHTFVVITADRDVAYCISTLRMRKYRVLVICPPGSHSDLRAQASAQLDWNHSILGDSNQHEDFQNGDIFGDAATRPGRKPRAFSFHTPAAPGSSAGSFQAAPPPTATGFSARASEFEKPAPATTSAGAELFELRDLPAARSRRNSLFSSSFRPAPHKFDVFGDLGDTSAPAAHTGPPKLGAFALGDGPLFPRTQSQSRFGTPARAESLPTNLMYSTKPPYIHAPEPDKPAAAASVAGSTTTWKGKERAFPILEPEVIAPHSPLAANYEAYVPRDLLDSPEEATKSRLNAASAPFMFGTGKGKERAFPIFEPESTAPPQAPPQSKYDSFLSRGSLFDPPSGMKSTAAKADAAPLFPSEQAAKAPSRSSTVSSKASRRSTLSALDHPQKSTAPTSADTAMSHDKPSDGQQTTLRDSAVELLNQTFNAPMTAVDEPPQLEKKAQEPVGPTLELGSMLAPELTASPPKEEKQTQTLQTLQYFDLPPDTPLQPVADLQGASSEPSKPPVPSPAPKPAKKPVASSSKAALKPTPLAVVAPNPGKYVTLVKVLQANERSSLRSTPKATLGESLRRHEAYRLQAGNTKHFFKHHIAGAVAAGIVRESSDRQSVMLLPPYAT